MWILVAVLLAAPLTEYPYAPDGAIARFATLSECMHKATELEPILQREGIPPFTLSCKPV